MINFTKEDIIFLYKKMIKYTGGTIGIREESLLDSAIYAPFSSYCGIELYPTTVEKAARLCYGLTANHPFIDGNKRIGIYAMLCYLEINNIYVIISNEEIIDLSLNIACGKYGYDEVLNIIKNKLI